MQGHVEKHQVAQEAEGEGELWARAFTVVSMGREGEARRCRIGQFE